MSSVSDRLAELAGQIGQISQQLADLQKEAAQAEEAGADLTSESSAAAAPGGQPELEAVNDALRKLACGETQERILEIYLEQAQAFVQRAILFLFREGKYVTWKGFGFSPPDIQEIALDDPMDSVVRAAQQRQLIYRRDHAADSLPWLAQAGDLPACTLCIPLVFDNTVPVVFYADADDAIAIDSLELLTHLAVLVLKNNYLHQLLNAQKEAAGEPAAEAAAAAAETWAEAPAEEAPAEAEEAWHEAPAEDFEAPPFEAQPEPEPEPEPAADMQEFPPEEAPAVEAEAAEAAGEAWEQPEPPYEPTAEPEIPSEKKEMDFDEQLAAAEKEIEFDIDLDTAPALDEWEAEQADEQLEAVAEEEPSAPEPEEDLEFQPFGSAGQEPSYGETPEQEHPEAEPAPFAEAQAEEAEAPFEEAAYEPEPEPEPEAEPEPEPAGSPYSFEASEELQQEAQPEYAEEAAAEPEPQPQAEAEAPEEAPALEAVQPEGEEEPEPAQEEAPPSEEDKKAHDEARRFARLLVSEIKLYNEDDVETGRQNGNLYQRLSRDINRSRDMYQKRVNSSVARNVDYFHEEVVRILAKGDAALLGSDYPGPQMG